MLLFKIKRMKEIWIVKRQEIFHSIRFTTRIYVDIYLLQTGAIRNLLLSMYLVSFRRIGKPVAQFVQLYVHIAHTHTEISIWFCSNYGSIFWPNLVWCHSNEKWKRNFSGNFADFLIICTSHLSTVMTTKN